MSTKLITLLIVSLIILQGCAVTAITAAVGTTTFIHDRRSAGAIIDDQSIEFKAATALRADKEIYSQSHININSYNGIVLITGEALTDELKRKVADEILAIDRVVHVHNELIVAAPSSLPSRANDTWITSKVKARFIADENVDPIHIKVITERSIVYLMGKVSTAEADKAAEIAAGSAGVQKLIKLFEYSD